MRIALVISLVSLLAACSGPQPSEEQAAPEVLMQVGDSVLTRRMVLDRLPAGISQADSARLFDAIVEEWLERNMLTDVAMHNIPDLERIDRLVEQYRCQLLAAEYRRLMSEQYSPKISADSVRLRYDSRPEAYILTSPIVKGLYVKLPTRSPQLAEVRSWIASASPDSIDALENYGLRDAMEYDYFGDQWVAWDEIARRIPTRLQQVPALGKVQETEVNGITYLVRIMDSRAEGTRMPFDFARLLIEQEIIEEQRAGYDRRLMRDIYDRQVDSRRIHPGTYVPLRYRDVPDEHK